MTDRLRILYAIQLHNGREFTAAELAAQTGVNLATVRTILHRERLLLEEIGRVEASTRGGRAIKYRLTETGKGELEAELAELKQYFSNSTGGQTGLERFSRPPAVMIAAEDLLRQSEQADTPERQNVLLNSALEYIESAREVLSRRDEAPYVRAQHEIELASLEGQALDFLYRGAPAIEPAPRSRIAALFETIRKNLAEVIRVPTLPELAFSPAGTVAIAAAAAAPIATAATLEVLNKPEQLVDLFHAARRHAAERHNQSEDARLPKSALIDAAQYYKRSIGFVPEPDLTDNVAIQIFHSFNPRFSIGSLAVLGCDPACYQEDVLELPKAPVAGASLSTSSVTVKSFNYHAACDELGYIGSPVQQRVMTAVNSSR